MSKGGKGACFEGRDGWKGCLLPARVSIFMFDAIPLENTFPYLYLVLASKQLCFPPGKDKNRRIENTFSELSRTISELLF